MPLIIQISIENKSYTPGEVVRAVIRVSNDLKPGLNSMEDASIIRLQSLVASSQGVEQLDPGWVSSSYYADKPHLNSSSKRIQTCMFRTNEAELAEEVRLSPGQQRRYAVALQLPKHLPPSFKGTCVSYVYEVRVVAKYETKPFNLDNLTLEISDAGVLEEKTVRKNFQVKIKSQSDEPLLRKTSAHSTILETSPKVNTSEVEVPVMKIEFQIGMEDTVQMQWDELNTEGSWAGGSDCSSHRLSGNLEHYGPHFGLDENSSNLGSDIQPIRNHEHSGNESETSSSRFSHTRLKSLSEPTTPIAATKLLTSSLNNRAYNLRLGDQKLVRFSLNPGLSQELHPGTTFGGILDFHEGLSSSSQEGLHKRCMSVNILLESEEEIEHAWLPPSLKSRDKCIIRRMYCEHMEVTSDVLVTNFVFSVPPNAPGTFRTPLISHRWVLRFEFLVGSSGLVDSTGAVIKANPRCESLVWSLPVLVKN